MAPDIEEKLMEVIKEAAHQLLVWEEARKKVLSQLASISNLLEQQATLQRCAQSQQLGVLSSYPGCTALLEVKITQSVGRALRFVERDKAKLTEVIRCLKDLSRECQKLFEEAAERRGLVDVSTDTAESFALSNYPYWLKELHSSYDEDTAGKMSVLEHLNYPSDACVQSARERWNEQPGPQDIVQCLQYTTRVARTDATSIKSDHFP